MKQDKYQWIKILIIGSILFTTTLFGAVSQEMITTKKNTPKGLWKAFSEAQHRVEINKDLKEGYRAYNPKNGYSIFYGEKGIKLQNSSWKFGMTLDAYGQEKTLRPVAKALLESKGNRLTFNRGDISEWYINGTKGLEQGFTLNKPKNYNQNKEVILSLNLKGNLTPKWKKKGQSISFYLKESHAFDYDKLKAFDAKGEPLPVNLTFNNNKLQIRVDTKKAKWPVMVDPIFVTEQKVVASNGASDDQFGISVSIDGDTAVIGAHSADTDDGAVYVFVRSGGTWTEQAILTASDGANNDFFGYSVSINKETILVGAYGDGTLAVKGAGYIFVRSGTTWSEQAKLVGAGAGNLEKIGISVSIYEDTALLGASGDDAGATNSGSAYVFTRSGTTWTEQAFLTALDGAKDDAFGISVALNGDTAVIGAHLDDDGGSGSGSAYVFTRSGTTWTQEAKIIASDDASGDEFGISVSIDKNTALIGAYFDESSAGSSYVFTRSGTTWTEEAKLTASDTASSDQFGISVYLNGNIALIGANFDDDGGSNSGSGYVFTRSGTTWTQVEKLVASDPLTNDEFGVSVAFDGDTALIGANLDDDNGGSSGSAYFKRFECGFTQNIVTDTWTMIALPCNTPTDTVTGIFSSIFDVNNYKNDWIVWKRNEATESYEELTLGSPMVQGVGYWLYTNQTNISWDVTGTVTSYVTSAECSKVEGCFEYTLTSPSGGSTHQNFVGFVGSGNILWSDVRFVVDGTVYTPSEAETATFVSKTYSVWNGSSYDSFDDVTPGMIGTLNSHKGLWVEVLSGASGKTVKILIPAN